MVLFVLSVILLFFVILFYPKLDQHEDLFAQIVIATITVLEVHTLWGYLIIELLQSGLDLFLFASMNYLLAVLIFLYWVIVKDKRLQKFTVSVHMWVMLGALLLIAIAIGIYRYGWKLDLFAYCSADSANHYARVYQIFKSGNVTSTNGRYFLHLNEALLLKCIASWIQPMHYYKVFLFGELFFFFLSGAMFYVLVSSRIESKRMSVAGVAIVLLYLLGYPLNNLLYGYSYLGASVTIAAHIIYLLDRFIDGQEIKPDVLLVLVVSCFSMYHCYSLLFLCVLAGIGIVYLVHLILEPTLVKIGMLVLAGIVIVIKMDMLILYWNNMFGMLGEDASMYRDFWSSMMWLIPFAIIGVFQCYRSKEKDTVASMLIGCILTMVIFLCMMWNGQINSYYFYKFHFLLWLCMFACAYVGISYILQKPSNHFIVYALAISLLFAMSGIGKTEAYTDIYEKNQEILVENTSNLDGEYQDLYAKVAELVEETQTLIPYIGSFEKYWGEYYYGLTNQADNKDLMLWFMQNNFQDAGENINEQIEQCIYNQFDKVPYILVERGSKAYWYGIGYYSKLDVVYENERGIIYKR